MTLAPDAHSSPEELSDLIEQQLESFDRAWHQGQTPQFDLFLRPFPKTNERCLAARRELLIELIKIDLEYRWRRVKNESNRRPPPLGGVPASPAIAIDEAFTLEEYQQKWPELGVWDDLPPELVVEEYRARKKWGDRPGRELFLARFPALVAKLPALLAGVDAELMEDTSGSVETHRRPAAPLPPAPVAADTPQPHLPANAPAPGAQTAPGPEPLPAQIGRYRVLSQLGRGSFGTVYKGLDEVLQRVVAIKVPRPDRWQKPADLDAFLGEARLAAQVRHPGLVEMFDVGRSDEFGCYIVMEFIEGDSLQAVIRNRRPDVVTTAELIARIAEAVHCAHKLGLVHCDLKPANILLDREQRPHVTDFGLVVSEQGQEQKAGQVFGSPAYMAPEQVRGEAHRFDGRTDLWALGVILYEMLTARKPFMATTAKLLFDEIEHREPKPPRQIDDTIPPDLEWICLKCLAKDVRERFSSGLDLAAELRAAIGANPTDGGPRPSPSHRLPQRALTNSPPHASHGGRGPASVRTNILNRTTTNFIGRQRELAELSAWLHDPATQLVTLLGPGGIGKTRLSLQLAEQFLDQRLGGCWFVELDEATTAEALAHAVARALGVQLAETESPVQAVAHILEFRKPMLLVLDNFEQLVAFAHETLGTWRRAAPQVQFLVSSRSALGLSGERTYELSPLPTPPADALLSATELDSFASVRLFCERAATARPGVQFDAPQFAAIAAICTALEGIPLALELAAARVKVLMPQEIAKRLGQKFQLLQSSRRDVGPRQQTLWGAIDWSMDLLSPCELAAFLQVCAFHGGFDWDAAEAVIDLRDFPDAPATLDVVQSLRDKSLLTRQETPLGTRFGLYQSIREYGEQRWQKEATPQQQRQLQQRLAEHFIAWAESWNARIGSADGPEALARLRLEIENLFAVQDYSLAAGDAVSAARAILAASRTLAVRGPADQRFPRLERSLFALGEASPELTVRLLIQAAEAAQAAGDWDRATASAERAVAAARPWGPELLASALRQRGEMHRHRGELAAACEVFERAEELATAVKDRAGVAASQAARGFVVWQRGDDELALQLLAQADATFRAQGSRLDSVVIARRRGHVLAQRGELFQALRCFAEAEATARELGDDRSLRLAIGDRGNALAQQGEFAGALECYQQAEQLAQRMGDKRGIAVTVGNRGILLADRGDPAQALACYEQAEATNRAIQSRHGIAVNLGNRAVALGDLGRFEEAFACLTEAENLSAQMGNRFLLALHRGDRAGLLFLQNQFEPARTELLAARELLAAVHSSHSVEGFLFESLLAQIEDRLAHPEAAARLAATALQLATELQLSDAHPKLKIRNHLSHLSHLRRLASSTPHSS